MPKPSKPRKERLAPKEEELAGKVEKLDIASDSDTSQQAKLDRLKGKLGELYASDSGLENEAGMDEKFTPSGDVVNIPHDHAGNSDRHQDNIRCRYHPGKLENRVRPFYSSHFSLFLF